MDAKSIFTKRFKIDYFVMEVYYLITLYWLRALCQTTKVDGDNESRTAI